MHLISAKDGIAYHGEITLFPRRMSGVGSMQWARDLEAPRPRCVAAGRSSYATSFTAGWNR